MIVGFLLLAFAASDNILIWVSPYASARTLDEYIRVCRVQSRNGLPLIGDPLLCVNDTYNIRNTILGHSLFTPNGGSNTAMGPGANMLTGTPSYTTQINLAEGYSTWPPSTGLTGCYPNGTVAYNNNCNNFTTPDDSASTASGVTSAYNAYEWIASTSVGCGVPTARVYCFAPIYVTSSPTFSPTTLSPTTLSPTSSSPTSSSPTTLSPSTSPTTSPTSSSPTTANPTTAFPTTSPTTLTPTSSPTTGTPTTAVPTTIAPTVALVNGVTSQQSLSGGFFVSLMLLFAFLPLLH